MVSYFPFQDHLLVTNTLLEVGFSNWSISQRRILTTRCVGETWERFCSKPEKQELVRQSFRRLGISLHWSGKEDHEINVKGLPGLEVGDWQRELFPEGYWNNNYYFQGDMDTREDESTSFEFIGGDERY